MCLTSKCQHVHLAKILEVYTGMKCYNSFRRDGVWAQPSVWWEDAWCHPNTALWTQTLNPSLSCHWTLLGPSLVDTRPYLSFIPGLLATRSKEWTCSRPELPAQARNTAMPPLASYGQFILWGQTNVEVLCCHILSAGFISPHCLKGSVP